MCGSKRPPVSTVFLFDSCRVVVHLPVHLRAIPSVDLHKTNLPRYGSAFGGPGIENEPYESNS